MLLILLRTIHPCMCFFFRWFLFFYLHFFIKIWLWSSCEITNFFLAMYAGLHSFSLQASIHLPLPTSQNPINNQWTDPNLHFPFFINALYSDINHNQEKRIYLMLLKFSFSHFPPGFNKKKVKIQILNFLTNQNNWNWGQYPFKNLL